jgi:hypothetical protein
MKFFVGLLASACFLSAPAMAEYYQAKVPAVCASDEEIIRGLTTEGFTVLAVTQMDKDQTPITLVVWRKEDKEIIVSRGRAGSDTTCIVGLGDSHTKIFGVK